jgi:glycosyltransferase involved in cell wall biosynthesis
VDSAGSGIAMAGHGGLPVRVVGGGPHLRPRAMNAGLEGATGEWLCFLDEDDEFTPDHLATLLAAAIANGARAAYSQTQLLDASGQPTRLLGGGPFSRAALLRSNYLAIHAVLFHRSLVDEGARVDESLEIFEDWDFWLLLSSRSDFAYTARATAIYHVEAGASGAGGGGNLNREQALAQRERLMRKWQAGA